MGYPLAGLHTYLNCGYSAVDPRRVTPCFLSRPLQILRRPRPLWSACWFLLARRPMLPCCHAAPICPPPRASMLLSFLHQSLTEQSGWPAVPRSYAYNVVYSMAARPQPPARRDWMGLYSGTRCKRLPMLPLSASRDAICPFPSSSASLACLSPVRAVRTPCLAAAAEAVCL